MMLQKNKSQRIALTKYGLSAPLFVLMLIFSSATVNNSKAVKVINKKTEKALLMPAADVVTAITDHAEIPSGRNAQLVKDTIPKDSKIFSQVEKQPQFPGGFGAFGKFLANNIHYPATDRMNKTQGKAIVTFVVEADGHLSNIKTIRSPSEEMGNEAVRVLSLSPHWLPGYQNGHPVRVSYTVPINFALNEQPVVNPDDKDKIYVQVDKQPQFPGGLEAFSKFLGATIKYPAEDREKGLSGRVICTFIVETDGSLSDIKAVRGPSEATKAEAVRVLAASPKWGAGVQNDHAVRVAYTVPINFALGEEDEPNTGYRVTNRNGGPPPLYILDGVELKADLSPLATMPKENIDRMEILKDETATKLYGERGKHGVILITTKKDQKSVGDINTKDLGVGNNPIFFIDGKETSITTIQGLLAVVPQKNIALMEVFKGKDAIAMYGSKGKNGVIRITTKKATKP